MKKIGFGTYRTGLQNSEHYEALKYALESGVRLVDTSANYVDGEAEKLIGKVLKDLDLPRDEIIIVSKGGYIQGKNYERVQKGQKVDELVKYSHGCYHSVHKEFLSDQIERSLSRLKLDYIDIYLLHNPEYYLMHNIKSESDDVKAHQNEMQRRIYEAFCKLEIEVKIGRIRGYGISSNSFSKKPSDVHFLEYKNLIEFAKEAAKNASNQTHSLKALQMPINLLEKDGLECAKWVHENGLKVLVNRPLNAFGEFGMVRLAEYPDAPEYEGFKNGALAQTAIDGTPKIASVIEELDKIKADITWCGAIDDVLYGKAIPMINSELRAMKHENIEHFIGVLNRFFDAYRKKAHHLISQKSKEEIGVAHGKSLQNEALRFLLDNPNIDYVLVGMRKREYVDDIKRIIDDQQID